MELGPRPGYWEANGIVCEGFVYLELLRKAIHLTLSLSGPMAAETCRLLFSKTFLRSLSPRWRSGRSRRQDQDPQ